MKRSGGPLAAAVAHDVNNMLAIVVSYAEVLANRLAPGDPGKHDLLELRLAAQRAADLAKQLVAIDRAQQAKPGPMCIDAQLAQIEGLLRRLVGDGVELVVHRTRELWPVMANPTNLERLVMNLASNARDAMRGRGTLTIATTNVEIDAGPHVMLSVRDSGPGIDEPTKARLFEPFFTTKPAGEGNGLGLAVALEIVRACGGVMRVESVVGEGATFLVYLPRVVRDLKDGEGTGA
jgi:two-component system cell cycle sensor histidine kinase/response regulator CckA